MRKQQEKMYKRVQKAGQALKADMRDHVNAAIAQYSLKQEKDIEEILSPFWAWKALQG